MPVYSSGQSNYYNATDFLFDGSKDHTRPYQQRQTPSGSVSPSLPQSLDQPPSTLSSTSGASGQSTTSSTVGSPYSLATHSLPGQDAWADLNQGLGIAPDIIHNDGFPQDPFPSGGLENESCFQTGKFSDSFVGECGRFSSVPPSQYFPNAQGLYDPRYVSSSPYSAPLQAPQGSMAASMKPSDSFPSVRRPHRLSISGERIEIPGSPSTRTDTMSPSRDKFRQPANSASVPPYPRGSEARRLSIASSISRQSQENTRSTSLSLDEDGKERGRCPNPDCGRLFKDLKAHMLTHQSERPEKCPIITCEYHQKGFARKYDKNRHTLTHYKGTMVCGFCPGSGSAAEKSFNRADVFKRHLTSLHGVEQTPPNSRKKSPTTSAAKKTSDFSGDAAGKCSTCSAMFSNAQEFYEHLDDCVLRVVQQEEPSEAINEQHLNEVAHDRSVLETLDRNMIQSANPKPFSADDDDEGSETGESKDEASSDWPRSTRSNPRSGKGQIKAGRDDSS
ncbi:MAG: hypothetical protein LQ339_006929 [Xanthoria mediterranea]|nr:MAG: hypothetical protein LQ339_006929 [Xanthoria mediterranea]